MSNFLSIFPEIREVIYIIILTSPDPPPLPSISRDHRFGFGPMLGRPNQGETCNRYLTIPPKIASTALLLCNQQIHTEISGTIARLKLTKKLYYEIDCEIANEQTLYPTWLLIPVHLTCIPCIYATFRLTGACIGQSLFWNGYKYGSPASGKMIWSLLSLLNRFLYRGPDFLAPPLTSKSLQVEKLVLNVTTPTLNAGEVLQAPQTKWNCGGAQEGEFVHPETVVNIMKGYLGIIFNKGRYGIAYGKFIASKVAIISLKCDGEERCTWDVANIEFCESDSEDEVEE